MRHRNRGRKLSRNTEHRRALLRNLVTSLILEERIRTTVPKAKEARRLAERIITLGKRGDLHSRRLASAYCMSPAAVQKLFGDIAQRFGSRPGGYTRMTRAGWRQGDGADVAVLELIDTKVLQKRAETRAKRAERHRKATEETAPPPEPAPPKGKDQE